MGALNARGETDKNDSDWNVTNLKHIQRPHLATPLKQWINS